MKLNKSYKFILAFVLIQMAFITDTLCQSDNAHLEMKKAIAGVGSKPEQSLHTVFCILADVEYDSKLSNAELAQLTGTKLVGWKEHIYNYDIVKLLISAFDKAKKSPEIALQFLLLAESISLESLRESEIETQKVRKFLFENRYLTFYHYYGIGKFYDDEDENFSNAYELLNEYAWAEEAEFLPSNPNHIGMIEVNADLAEYIGNGYYSSVVEDHVGRPYIYYQNLKKWSDVDLLAVWYKMLDASEKGEFEKALLYGNLAKNIDVNGSNSKLFHTGFLDDYENVKGSLFNKSQVKDTVKRNLPWYRKKFDKTEQEVTALMDKANTGKMTKEEIDKAAAKMDRIMSPFRKKRYFEFGLYDIDLSIAMLYKEYGYKQEALKRAELLVEVDTLSLEYFFNNKFVLDDYFYFRTNMLLFYSGLDIKKVEAQLMEIEKIIQVVVTQKDFASGRSLVAEALIENLEKWNSLLSIKRKSSAEIKQAVSGIERPDIMLDVTAFFPFQFNAPIFVAAPYVKQLLVETYPVFESAEFEKYRTVGYPLVYGISKESLAGMLTEYHDILKSQNRLFDFEPWYTFTMDLHDELKYTRQFSYTEFHDDIFITNLAGEKGYLNKVEHIINKWKKRTELTGDTVSIIYAYMLSGELSFLDDKLSNNEKSKIASTYFEIVKTRGNCSQCYVVSALQLAGVYVESKDTIKAQQILDDLLQKLNADLITNELKALIYAKQIELLVQKMAMNPTSIGSRKKILDQLEIISGKAIGLDPTYDPDFVLMQLWVNLERKELNEKVSADRLWNLFEKSHKEYTKNSALFTDNDRKNYFEDMQIVLDLNTWRYSIKPEEDENYAKRIFEYTAYYKSFVGSSYSDIKQYLQKQPTSKVSILFEELSKIRSGKQVGRSNSAYEEFKLEREILIEIANDSIRKRNQPIEFDQLKSRLKKNEFIVNITNTVNHITGEKVYFAQIAGVDYSSPKFVHLGSADLLEGKAYKTYYDNIQNLVNYNVNDTLAYSYYWKKIATHIPNGSGIYVLNEGIYHKINLGSIPFKGKYLCDRYEFHSILRLEDIGANFGKLGVIKADVFGDPKFNLGYSRFDALKIEELPNTKTECLEIDRILSSIDNSLISSHLNDKATEDDFKALSNPEILHVASHGFFIPEKKIAATQTAYSGDIKFRSSTFDFENTSDPMLRSGILFSGAQNTLNGTSKMSRYNESLQEDGILTAKEAMILNLDSTKLVVLSACETGLGDITPGQSISGLQKGFKIAGADYLVLTLWSVDDKATFEFMRLFYLNIAKFSNKDNGIEAAFFETQKEFKKNPQYAHPFFWGAFVLLK